MYVPQTEAGHVRKKGESINVNDLGVFNARLVLFLRIKRKKKKQIMHLAHIMNAFQHGEDGVGFKLLECLYEEV